MHQCAQQELAHMHMNKFMDSTKKQAESGDEFMHV